jgi:hypothetical protein
MCASLYMYVGQVCQILFGTTYQNGGKIHKIIMKCTQWLQNIPNGYKIDQMVICKMYQDFPI